MENGAKTGYVHSLESFGSVDGPGVRYVIFLSGCAMRCQFCHNPDTWNMTAGKSYTADALLKQAVKYRTYWGNKGGITVSGGEPLLQIDFLIELFRKAKEMGIHTTLDTSGNPYTEKEPFYSKWLELMKYTDLILLDIKHIDEQEHIKLLSVPKSIVFIVGGAVAIAVGGDVTVDAAARIAGDLGMSQTLIGLTIVSIGTSLPELVTSIVAARKNEVDMALGNAIGSNIFNILMVLGIASAISPMAIITENIIDLCVLIVFTVCVWIFAGTKKKIGRVEGFCMVAFYAVYAIYIIIR